MALTITDEKKISKNYAEEEFVQKRMTATVNTAEIVSEALLLDTFITNNLTAINNVFTPGFRNKTTGSQRLKLFKLVVAQLELK